MIFTHSNRKIDITHTSYAEIQAFYQICKDRMIFGNNIYFSDYERLSQTVYERDMTVFHCGKDVNDTILELANQCANLYIVVQDPNWNTDLTMFKRPFHLITPFKALKHLPLDDKQFHRLLSKAIPKYDKDMIIDHHVIEFGNMVVYNERYLSSMRAPLPSNVPLNNHNLVYVGSLKKDRINDLFDLADSGESIDFYGNFTKQQFEAMRSKKLSDKSRARFLGKIPSNSVATVYSKYKEVCFAPDQKIESLKTSYLRYAEMALGANKVRVIGKHANSELIDKIFNHSECRPFVAFTKLAKTSPLIPQIRSAYAEVTEEPR